MLKQDEVALLLAAPEQFVAGVVPHPYRPDPDLHYLTGLQQKNVRMLDCLTRGCTGLYEKTLFAFADSLYIDPEPVPCSLAGRNK